jgi:hypothetical protein
MVGSSFQPTFFRKPLQKRKKILQLKKIPDIQAAFLMNGMSALKRPTSFPVI